MQKQLQQVALHEYRANSGGPQSQLKKRRLPHCLARREAARELPVSPRSLGSADNLWILQGVQVTPVAWAVQMALRSYREGHAQVISRWC